MTPPGLELALVWRAIVHRLRHGRPRSLLGNMAPAMRALAGAEIDRCPCGAIETTLRGECVEADRAKRCPTFELRDRLRRSPLPRAVARSRAT